VRLVAPHAGAANRTLWGALLAFALVPVVVRANGNDAVAPAEGVAPDVDSLIERALERAPEIPAYEARSRAAREREAPAAALPDPSIDLIAEGMGLAPPGPSSTLVVEVSQELPFPGKRAARRAAAEAETSVRAADVGDAKRRIAAQVRIVYARVYALDREREKLTATRDLLGLLSRTVAARYSTGQADRAALLRVDLEDTRVEERLVEIEGDRKGEVAALNRLLDLPADAPFGRVLDLPRVTVPDAGPDGIAVEGSPELAVLRAESAAAARRVEKSRVEEKPDFSLGLGGGIDGMVEPVVMLRFGVAIPLWRGDKQAPLTRAASEDFDAAEDDVRAKEIELRTRAAALRAALARDEALVALYAGSIIPQSRGVFEATQSAYLADRGDFPSVIESYEALLEAEVGLARREASRFETWALLAQLTEKR
jgi:outer membrane protein, heavy metal efflux system